MDFDLTKFLAEWPYEPGKISCRLITGLDGEPRVQVRVELGVIQMNVEGRPDGQRPHDFPSLLDYFEHLLDGGNPDAPPQAAGRGGEPTEPGDRPEFSDSPDASAQEPAKTSLTVDDCRALREEAEQYYRRYVAFLALEQFDLVVRDTTRNLRVLDIIRDHAEREEDRQGLEDLRPYILMMRTRAVASMALRDNEPKAAILALDEGLESLKRAYSDSGHPHLFDKSSEARTLRLMRDDLVPKLPVSQKAELRARLAQAIDEENYELAAILRDELKQLPE